MGTTQSVGYGQRKSFARALHIIDKYGDSETYPVESSVDSSGCSRHGPEVSRVNYRRCQVFGVRYLWKRRSENSLDASIH